MNYKLFVAGVQYINYNRMFYRVNVWVRGIGGMAARLVFSGFTCIMADSALNFYLIRRVHAAHGRDICAAYRMFCATLANNQLEEGIYSDFLQLP